ncbi:hypothetical protein Dda_2524 [Drechslerella dactyloides]|uniref:Uncharacterized protein n=1 Tax=Drechslerella dactyloides TaxID=74499 RepID=A0AAD6J058_DREDA|nr:hypothetical protein Dda_2524 [Drechslerella dactyloides]
MFEFPRMECPPETLVPNPATHKLDRIPPLINFETQTYAIRNHRPAAMSAAIATPQPRTLNVTIDYSGMLPDWSKWCPWLSKIMQLRIDGIIIPALQAPQGKAADVSDRQYLEEIREHYRPFGIRNLIYTESEATLTYRHMNDDANSPLQVYTVPLSKYPSRQNYRIHDSVTRAKDQHLQMNLQSRLARAGVRPYTLFMAIIAAIVVIVITSIQAVAEFKKTKSAKGKHLVTKAVINLGFRLYLTAMAANNQIQGTRTLQARFRYPNSFKWDTPYKALNCKRDGLLWISKLARFESVSMTLHNFWLNTPNIPDRRYVIDMRTYRPFFVKLMYREERITFRRDDPGAQPFNIPPTLPPGAPDTHRVHPAVLAGETGPLDVDFEFTLFAKILITAFVPVAVALAVALFVATLTRALTNDLPIPPSDGLAASSTKNEM